MLCDKPVLTQYTNINAPSKYTPISTDGRAVVASPFYNHTCDHHMTCSLAMAVERKSWAEQGTSSIAY